MMSLGTIVVADEDGNIIEQSTTVIEDGATTWVKKENRYTKTDER